MKRTTAPPGHSAHEDHYSYNTVTVTDPPGLGAKTTVIGRRHLK